jgi:DNA-binding transcriptional ArsR family regulator
MSVLDRFVRIRRFRALAGENYGLAAESFSESVRARYLAIADHYAALADAELLSDKRERKWRLAEMQAQRVAGRAQKSQEPVPATPQPAALAAAAPVRKLRLIKGDGATADKRRVSMPTRHHPSLAGIAAKRER